MALLDYAYQWWRNEQDLKMTPQELREEMRNLEGNPQVIARRKQVRRDLVLQRIAALVSQSNVVLTNPSQLAIALRYDPETMAAPVVVAKGAGVWAEHIRRAAADAGVPALERKRLARALYRQVDPQQPIPADQFAAVAEALRANLAAPVVDTRSQPPSSASTCRAVRRHPDAASAHVNSPISNGFPGALISKMAIRDPYALKLARRDERWEAGRKGNVIWDVGAEV